MGTSNTKSTSLSPRTALNILFKSLQVAYRSYQKRMEIWSRNHIGDLALYNLIIIVLVLLHSAGYFHPFFPITINIISLIALVGAIILLGARTNLLFTLSAFFLIFAGLMLILNVRIWADRTMIYMFQSLVLGILLLFLEDSGTIN